MKAEDLQQILSDHLLWMNSSDKGKRADLRGAYLQDADLRGADLQGAYLRGAYLQGADLRGAYLRGADLQDADLRGADLQGADLRRADLRGADLQGADLRSADLQGAYLRGAYLQGADLRRADLRGADLQGADLPHFQIPDGDLIVWKKGRNSELIKLLIPKEAKRTISLVGRKCRAEYADVLEIWEKGQPIESAQCWNSSYDIIYEVGKRIYPDKYDDDIRIECTSGIHFFLTKLEAEKWQ